MITRVKRWGNSLGLIVPAAVARSQNIRDGDYLEVEIRRRVPTPSELSGTWKFRRRDPRRHGHAGAVAAWKGPDFLRRRRELPSGSAEEASVPDRRSGVQRAARRCLHPHLGKPVRRLIRSNRLRAQGPDAPRPYIRRRQTGPAI